MKKSFLDPFALCSVLKATMISLSISLVFLGVKYSRWGLLTSRSALSSDESSCWRQGPFPHTKFHSAYITFKCVHNNFITISGWSFVQSPENLPRKNL